MGATGLELVNELKRYVPRTTESDLMWLIGKLIVEGSVRIKDVASYLGMSIEEAEIFLGKLLQYQGFPAKFRDDRFVLTKSFVFEPSDDDNLSKQEEEFLGYLKGRGAFVAKEIEFIFGWNEKDAWRRFYALIIRGYVTASIVMGTVTPKVTFSPEPLSPEDITDQDIVIVGMFQLFQEATISRIRELVQYPYDTIIRRLFLLSFYEAIQAKFLFIDRIMRSPSLVVKQARFLVQFPRRSVTILQENEKLVIGLVLMMRKVSYKRIALIMEVSEEEVLRIAAQLTATKVVPLAMDSEGNMFMSMPVDYRPYRSLEQIQRLSLFNYHVLLGLLATHRTINLKVIAKRMNEPAFEVLRGIIVLVLEGFLVCKMNRKYDITLEEIRTYSGVGEKAVEKWEAVIIGALQLHGFVDILEISKLLKVSKRVALELAYTVVARGLVKARVKLDRVLRALEPVHVPPTIHPSELELRERQILGYLFLKRETDWKELRKGWRLNALEAHQIIYMLAGYGLVTLILKGKKLHVIERANVKPNRSVEELGKHAEKIYNALERLPDAITIRELVNVSRIKRHEVLHALYELAAEGFVVGELGVELFKKSAIKRAPRIPRCLSCKEELPEPNSECPSCGAPPPTCSVCRGAIDSRDPIARCPSCKYVAHDSHLKEWLKIKGECPVCRAQLAWEEVLLE